MPLIKSGSEQAFKTNVGNLMKEVGSSPHVQSRNQALAIAYDIKRRNRAAGGLAPTPWQTRAESRGMMHTGPISSIVPGRTDHHSMSVPSGSYVVPAETVSHLGQSNTNSGMAVLSHMFGPSGPYGVGRDLGIKRGAGAPRPPALRVPRASGGASDRGGGRGDDAIGHPTAVNTAGGEYVIDPATVMRIGGGDIKKGHAALDAWIMKMRKDHIKTLKGLAPPAKS